MKKENFFNKSLKIGALLTILVSARVATSFESTWRVFEAFSGKKVSCTSGEGFDAILVPGAGIIRDSLGNVVPNAAGKHRLAGAVGAYFNRVAPRIVLVGDSVDLSKNFLEKEFSIPEKDIVTTPPAINTATEMARVRDIALERGWNEW